MVEHNVATDPEIHEPKGVSTANAEEVYLADGLGSGSWKRGSGTIYGVLCSVPSDSVSISTIGTTAKKLACFTTGPLFNGVTLSVANDDVTIITSGIYRIDFTISFSTTASADNGDYEMVIAKNGVTTNFGFKREMSGSNDTGAAATTSIVSLAASDVISIRVSSDNGSDTDDIDIQYCALSIQLLEAT